MLILNDENRRSARIIQLEKTQAKWVANVVIWCNHQSEVSIFHYFIKFTRFKRLATARITLILFRPSDSFKKVVLQICSPCNNKNDFLFRCLDYVESSRTRLAHEQRFGACHVAVHRSYRFDRAIIMKSKNIVRRSSIADLTTSTPTTSRAIHPIKPALKGNRPAPFNITGRRKTVHFDNCLNSMGSSVLGQNGLSGLNGANMVSERVAVASTSVRSTASMATRDEPINLSMDLSPMTSMNDTDDDDFNPPEMSGPGDSPLKLIGHSTVLSTLTSTNNAKVGDIGATETSGNGPIGATDMRSNVQMPPIDGPLDLSMKPVELFGNWSSISTKNTPKTKPFRVAEYIQQSLNDFCLNERAYDKKYINASPPIYGFHFGTLNFDSE